MALPTFLSVQEVADSFKVSDKTIIRLIASGKLQAAKLNGKDYRIEEKDVMDLWNKRKQGK